MIELAVKTVVVIINNSLNSQFMFKPFADVIHFTNNVVRKELIIYTGYAKTFFGTVI